MPWSAVVGALVGAVATSALTDDDPGGAKEQSAELSVIQGQAIRDQGVMARELHDYYKSTFQPLEKSLVGTGTDFLGKVGTFGTPAEQELRAGEAHADVTQAFARSREATRRSLAGFGINPASGRFANAELTSNLAEAKSSAWAQNLARKGVRDEAFNKDIAVTGVAQNIAGLGRNLPATAQTGLGSVASTSGAAAAREALIGLARREEQRQGMAPIVSAVGKGIQKWWDTPSTNYPEYDTTNLNPAGGLEGP